jgi:PAS domain S-box-containing protein
MPNKLLLVEDEAIIALNEARMIEQHGYEVETVHSGKQAVETATTEPEIVLVLMDIDLGRGMDGTEAARRILETQDIPIVFLSAHAEREFVERVKQITNYGYVLKNSGEFVLIESIEKAFELFAAHKKVEQREREYREVLENVDSAVLRLDPHGRVTFFSKGAERIFGYTAEEIIGQDEIDIIIPRRDKFGNDLCAMYWDLIAEPEQYSDHENENMRKDGTRLWMRWKNKRIYDSEGTFLYIQAIGDDITERKRMEESLRRERDRAQTYLSVARVIFVAIDKDERISLINRKGCEILGYSQEEILGKNWFDTFLPEKEREQVRSVFQELMAGDIEAVEYFENSIVTKSGEERIIAWHNTTLKDEDGHVITSLSSGEDITPSG